MMKQSKQDILLNYSASDLYKIVLDIEKYPNYIPWCSNVKILNKKKKQIKAEMIVNYKFFPSQKFTSNVQFNLEKLTIKTKYIEGPLKDLQTLWEFKILKKKQTKIIFTIEFEFKNIFHQKIAELFFPLLEKKMIKSFIQRAENIL